MSKSRTPDFWSDNNTYTDSPRSAPSRPYEPDERRRSRQDYYGAPDSRQDSRSPYGTQPARSGYYNQPQEPRSSGTARQPVRQDNHGTLFDSSGNGKSAPDGKGFSEKLHSKYFVTNVLFFLFVAMVGALFYLLPNKPTVSEREKRELATLPELTAESLMDGSYTSDYSVYFADNFPFRETLIEIAQRIDALTGTTNEDGVQIIEVAVTDDEAFEEIEEIIEEPLSPSDIPAGILSDSDVPDPEEEEEDPDAAFEDAERINESLYVADGTVLTIVYQTKSVARDYATAVNNFAKTYPDAQVHCALLPIASAYYLPEKYRTSGTDQKTMIDYIYGRLNESVNTVDVYSALAHHADEYIYFRTDHHWTGLGAYYAYEEFVTEQGMEAMDISVLDTVVYPDYLGTLYNKVGGNAEMRENPDQVIAYDIDAAYPVTVDYWQDLKGDVRNYPLIIKNLKQSEDNKYKVFTYGDWRFIKITTANTTGKKILVFKDSFANAFVPYLVANYDVVYVADPRYNLPSIKRLMKNEGITDVLFLTNLTNSSVRQRVTEYGRMYYY